MPYDPDIHKRHSIRLKGYDYSQAGLYFITLCCQDKQCWFGNIVNDQMILNEYGMIAFEEWNRLPDRFANLELDVFQIMPNHIHAIFTIQDRPAPVGAGFTPALVTDRLAPRPSESARQRAGVNPAPTVATVVASYKSLVAKACLERFKAQNTTMGKLWQRNYYEHIIRNHPSYQNIADYVISNPAKWQDDQLYTV